MNKQITIFGAGFAGLIAARMLHERSPKVFDAQDSIPNNHKAVLRFRDSIVGDVTNIPLRKVKVVKAVVWGMNDVQSAVQYSLKTTGMLHMRSIIDTENVDRYVAPEDFITRLASTVDFSGGMDFVQWSSNLIKKDRGPVISTIPMVTMMDIFKWEGRPTMEFHKGWNLRVSLHKHLKCNLNMTLYNPRQQEPWYRATITEGVVIFEGMGDAPPYSDGVLNMWLQMVGLDLNHAEEANMSKSRYQKIVDLSQSDRVKANMFMVWLSKEHGIYSLGRFATWRPKLLLDDLVNDVRMITKMIDGETNIGLPSR